MGAPGECERIGEKCSLVGFESSLRRREREREVQGVNGYMKRRYNTFVIGHLGKLSCA